MTESGCFGSGSFSLPGDYPVLRTAQSDLQFTHYSLFNQTPSQPGWLDPWEAFSYAAIKARWLLVQTDTTVQVLIHTAE